MLLQMLVRKQSKKPVKRTRQVSTWTNQRSQNHVGSLSYQNALFDTLKARKSDGADIEIIHELNGADVDWALGAAIVHYIKKQNTVIVSDDAVKSYNSFLPAYITTTAEIGGMIITMATLYVCVCRGLLWPRKRTEWAPSAWHRFGGVREQQWQQVSLKTIAKFLKMHISSISKRRTRPEEGGMFTAAMPLCFQAKSGSLKKVYHK